MLTNVPEIRLADARPDRILILDSRIPAREASRIATSAVLIARQRAPKLSGNGALSLQPVSGEGMAGIYFPDPVMWYQDHGTKPFTMRNLAGKAQPLTEPVLTPAGWAKMGDIRPGGYVVGSDGRPTRVVEVFPQGIKDCYRITFSDGESVRCSGDHLWSVYRDGNDADYCRRPQTKTTLELLKAKSLRVWSVPTVAPVEGLTIHTDIDPYLLGVMLSEGCRGASPTFAQQQMPVVDEVRAVLPEGAILTGYGDRRWTITFGMRGTTHNPLAQALRDLGVWNLYSFDKFTPEPYFGASVQQRLGLLQGLMDGDGSCPAFGSVQYHTSSLRLAQDVVELVQGLGGIARLRSENGPRKHANHAMHTVGFVLPAGLEPFRANLEKKLVRFRSTPRRAASRKRIVSIEADGAEEMQCILVDAPDHLYITTGYTLTHNTIPMWVDDIDGSLRAKNPKIETRTTASGKTQVLIFRKAGAMPGQAGTKPFYDPKTGKPRKTWPGAPGRISRREAGRPMTTEGRTPGAIARGNVGVKWRHPGITPRLFLNNALVLATQRHGYAIDRCYIADGGSNIQAYLR